jgi:hypothetical protein
MVAGRVVCAVWLGVTLTGAGLGVALGAGAGAAATTGAGGAGREATGTALWQAAMDRIPTKPKAIRICCLIIFIKLLLNLAVRRSRLISIESPAPKLFVYIHQT